MPVITFQYMLLALTSDILTVKFLLVFSVPFASCSSTTNDLITPFLCVSGTSAHVMLISVELILIPVTFDGAPLGAVGSISFKLFSLKPKEMAKMRLLAVWIDQK